MDSTESAQELENAIRAHISFLEHAKRLVQAQIEERRKSIEKTKLELQTLRTANNCFDQIFLQQSAKANKLKLAINESTSDQTNKAPNVGSPRSESAICRLNSLEDMLFSYENELFSLVPKVSRLETRTTLAILSGKTEELQAKHVDAVQSLGLSSQHIVATRRRSLVKRLDILWNLSKNLHKICGDNKQESFT